MMIEKYPLDRVAEAYEQGRRERGNEYSFGLLGRPKTYATPRTERLLFDITSVPIRGETVLVVGLVDKRSWTLSARRSSGR